MAKYILSTGKVTEKREVYIADLFKLNIGIYPGDIPGYRTVGFNFNLEGTKKSEVREVVFNRLQGLAERISEQFSGVKVSVVSVNVISETKLHAVIKVDDYEDDLSIEL